MLDLIHEKCEACNANSKKLNDEELLSLSLAIKTWSIIKINDIKQLQREYKFKNFKESIEFTNKVAVLAEEEFHHPSILTEWGKVTVTFLTHSINGLHKNDFICASKTEELFQG